MYKINSSSIGVYLWAVMLFFLLSCREEPPGLPDDRVPARFISGLSGTEPVSRAVDNRWTAGDPVGICLLEKSGADDDYPLVSPSGFKRYVATGGGEQTSLTPATAGQTIYYPVTGEVRFIAFCPYTESTTVSDAYEVTYTGFADQSSGTAGVTAKMEKVDFLYCKKTDALYSKLNPTANLAFEHRFSKLVVLVETSGEADADRVDLSRLSVTISNLPGSATVSLESGELTEAGALSAEETKPCVMVQGTSLYESHTVVVPHRGTSAVSVITFRIAGEETVAYAMKRDYQFDPGFSYVMKFKLTKGKVALVGDRDVEWAEGAVVWSGGYILSTDPLVEFSETGREDVVLYLKSNSPEEKMNSVSVTYDPGDFDGDPAWLTGGSGVTFVRAEEGYNVYSLTYKVKSYYAAGNSRVGYIRIDFDGARLPVEVRQSGPELFPGGRSFEVQRPLKSFAMSVNR